MKLYHLTAKPREKSTKGALNQEKGQGFVPAVVYGKEENINLFVFINDLNHLINTSEVYQVHLKVGSSDYLTIIKEIQFNPLSDQPSHIDFLLIDDNKVVTIDFPIQLVGSPVGVRQGGKLYKKLRSLHLKGKISDMPEHVIIDVAALDIGSTIKVKDVKIPGISILEQPGTPIASVSRTRVVEPTEAEAAAAAATAAPAETAEAKPAAGGTGKKSEK
jgi:large subunit ribosomal protein L25